MLTVDDLKQAKHPTIVFDGKCVLCMRFFRFVYRFDKEQKFRFVVAQSPLGLSLYNALDLRSDEFETNIVIGRGKVFTFANAFAGAMAMMPWPFKIMSVILYSPPWPKHAVYRLIGRNRYRLFGRTDSCMVPDDALRARFLPQGW